MAGKTYKEYSKASVSKRKATSTWGASLRWREVTEEVNEDGTVTEAKGKWHQLTKTTGVKCVLDPDGTPRDKRDNRGRQTAQKKADEWRASLIQEDEDAEARKAEMEAERIEAERRRIEEQKEAERLAALKATEKTVREYLAISIENMRGYVEESTIKGYRTQERQINKAFGDVLLKELTADMIREWEADMKKRYSPVTVKKAHGFLKARMQEALEDGLIDRLPFTRKMKPPKLDHKEPNALDANGRSRVLALLDGAESEIAIAAQIAIYTGMRRGEICGLTWENVAIERGENGKPSGGTITVSTSIGVGNGTYLKQTKTDRVRYVPVHAELAAILSKRKADMREECMSFGVPFTDKHYVLGNANGDYRSPDVITREWAILARLHNIKGTQGEIVTFHDLRHTWATAAIRNNIDVKTVAKVLGHASAKMTLDVYASAEDETMREAVKTVGDSMQGGKAEADVVPFHRAVND